MSGILKLAGREMACRDSMTAGRMMKLAKGMQATHPMQQYATMYDFACALVLPKYRATLDEALDDVETIDEFNEALGDAIKSITGRPTEAVSSSPDGQPNTSPTSRVVSFSQATAPTVTEPSEPGRSEAG